MKDYVKFLIKGCYIVLRRILEPFFKLKHYLRYEILRNPPFKMKYYGYNLFYDKGDGSINHLASGYTYEKDLIFNVVDSLKDRSVVFDVGSNIGLITLAIARLKPNVIFHCFEPSQYSYSFFNKTIKQNRLTQRIKLNRIGLYNRPGRRKFFIHSHQHALGDGFKDTGRAGNSKQVFIRATTLDEYVKRNNIRKLDLIKIDVEGAESSVLKGAVKSIRRFRPRIIFEASVKNLKAYNLNVKEIYRYLRKIDYDVYTLRSDCLDEESFIKSSEKIENYFAIPS